MKEPSQQPQRSEQDVVKQRANLEIDYPQPPATEQEWTPEYVARQISRGRAEKGPNGYKIVADAHNAALAAAVDDFTRYHHNPIVAYLNKQLAAEQEVLKEALKFYAREKSIGILRGVARKALKKVKQ